MTVRCCVRSSIQANKMFCRNGGWSLLLPYGKRLFQQPDRPALAVVAAVFSLSTFCEYNNTARKYYTRPFLHVKSPPFSWYISHKGSLVVAFCYELRRRTKSSLSTRQPRQRSERSRGTIAPSTTRPQKYDRHPPQCSSKNTTTTATDCGYG